MTPQPTNEVLRHDGSRFRGRRRGGRLNQARGSAHARAARGLRDTWRDTALPPRLAQFRVMLRLWGDAFAKVLSPVIRALPATALRFTLWAAELALIGIIAEAVMVLPMATYFHRATVFGLPANMVSIPLVAVLVPLGLTTFLASLVSPWLAALPASFLALLLHSITALITRGSRFPSADLRVPGPTLAHALAARAADRPRVARRGRAIAAPRARPGEPGFTSTLQTASQRRRRR